MAIKDAIEIIEIACEKWDLGYDQGNRCAFHDGGETDCSALVIISCEMAGLLPGNNIRKNVGAVDTRTMLKGFQERGWRAYGNLPEHKLHAGDVLLVPGHHTAMYVGNGRIAQARIDENGNIVGGALGNQTQRETVVCRYYDKPWKHVLRFAGTAQTAHVPPTAKPGMLDVDGSFGPASANRLQAVLGVERTGKIDKHTFAALQNHIGAPYHDGVADNQNTKEIAAHWPSLKSFTEGRGGSDSVKKLQARLDVRQDGELGEKTASALQRRLNTGRL